MLRFATLATMVGIMVLVSGCGGGGGTIGTSPESAPAAAPAVERVNLEVQFDRFLLNQSLYRAPGSSVSKSILPNLHSLRLEVAAPGLNLQTYTYGASATSATLTLQVGFLYTLTVTALAGPNGESVIARGTGELDLLASPPAGVLPKATVRLEVLDPSDIVSAVWPQSGNILASQNIYFFLNRSGKIRYSINGSEFLTVDGIPSTAGQVQSANNGVPVLLSGNLGDTIEVRYAGEDEFGKIEQIKKAAYKIIELTRFEPIEMSQVHGPVMTSASWGVAEIIPVDQVFFPAQPQ